MKFLKSFFTIFFTLFVLLLSHFAIHAAEYDFVLTNSTEVAYTTGNDYTDVTINLTREVKDKKYYFSTQGSHTFFIPDLVFDNEEDIKREREFKKESLIVKNDKGQDIPYTIEELEYGEGMNIKVPNYRDTTYAVPYKIKVNFKTHDYVKNIYDWVLIEYPMLSKDTKFEIKDESTNTIALVNYNLNITVDNNIPQLAKVYPANYEVKKDKTSTTFTFKGQDRVEKPVYLEFGTERDYKFRVVLKTQKTDTVIPEKYSSNFSALSTNIYEITLPREFSENNQSVRIEKISPTPTKLIIDTEGNVRATFEVPANKESEITVSGYIHLEQKPLEEAIQIPNVVLKQYFEKVKSDQNLAKYLSATKYWEINDSFIKQEAEKLLEGKQTVLDVIQADYQYINDKLEYNSSKASDPSRIRIGAKAALQGGDSVCMEYSDAMIAILRAQGIAARAASGYTNINPSVTEKESHQWVQVWIPEYGWLTVDPSHEGSNMTIGQNVQYVLWNTTYDDSNVDIKAYSANEFKIDTSKYNISISAVDKKEIPLNLLSYSDIKTENKENSTKDTINMIVKTTSIGKIALIILPVILIVVLLVALISLINILIKRTKTHKEPVNQQH